LPTRKGLVIEELTWEEGLVIEELTWEEGLVIEELTREGGPKLRPGPNLGPKRPK